MGRTYSELKKAVGKAGYTKEWKNKNEEKTKEYKDIKVSNLNLDFIKSDLEKEIGFPSFSSDINKVNKRLTDAYNGWQTPETMASTKASVENMKNRIHKYNDYQKVFGGEGPDLADLSKSYFTALDNWDKLASHYSDFKDANAYGAYKKEQKKLSELYSMSSEDVKPYLDDKKNAIAYTTADGYNILWKDLYNDANLREFESEIDSTIDVKELGKYKKKNVEYPYGFGSQYPAISDEDAHLYNLVNGDKKASDVEEVFNVGMMNTNDSIKYKYFSEDEKMRFNAIWETQGPEKAKEYAELLSSDLRQRRIQHAKEVNEAMATEDPIGASVVSALAKPFNDTLSAVGMGVDYFDDGGIDPYSSLYTNKRTIDTWRSTVESNIDNDVGEFFYRHGMNLADNVSRLAYSGFGTLGPVSSVLNSSIASLGSFTDTTLEARKRGLSDEQALGLGAVAGGAEYFFESKGFEALFGSESMSKGVRGYLVNNIVTELSGEIGTEAATDVADFLIAQDMNQWKLSIDQYKASGMTEKEALNKTISDNVWKYADIAAGTVLTSGTMAGPSAINLHSANVNMGRDIRESGLSNDVFDMANNPEFADTYNAYTAYAKKGINADNISNVKLGGLYRSLDYEAQEGFATANRDIGKAKKTIERQKFLRDVYTDTDVQHQNATKKLDKAIAKQTDAQVRRLGSAETLSKLGDIENKIYESKAKKAYEKAEADKRAKHEAEVKELSSGAETSVIANTDKAIEIKGVKDKDTLITSEGEVAFKDVELSDNDARLFSYARGMASDEASLYYAQYDGKADVEEFTADFNRVMEYAKHSGFTENYILEHKGGLSGEQVSAIYQNTVIKEARLKEEQNRKLMATTANGTAYTGYIDETAITKEIWDGLNDRQRNAVEFIKTFAVKSGMNLKIERFSKDSNGAFDITDNTIHVSVGAGIMPWANKFEDSIIPTASHEITHWMEEKSPELYVKLKDTVLEALETAMGKSQADIIADEIARLDRTHKNKKHTEKDAVNEIVARACEDMLSMSEEGRKMFDSMTEAEKKTFVGKVKEILENLRKWIDELLSSYKSETDEARALQNYKDKLAEISKIWDEMLVHSIEVNQALEKADVFGKANKSLAKVGLQVDAETESVAPSMQFSEKTWKESEYVQDREVAVNAIVKAIGVSKADAERYINNINSIARMIADDRARLDYDENVDGTSTALKPNSEYKWTVDMSTLCAKRLLFTGTFDAIQKAMPNRAFTSEELIDLRSMMVKKGYEVACGICYVESTRREMGPITEEFINQYKEAQKTGKPIQRRNSENKLIDLHKTKEQMESTVDKSTEYFYADAEYTPTLANLNTTDIDIVKRDHPLVYEAYLNFMNARGQAKPKLLETRTAYKGEILKHFKNKSAVKARNEAGGLRVQSFSDFEVAHLIDMMQIVLDMSRVGLMSQAYTKVPAFADVFGGTGMKINLSLIAKDSGLDENGNLIFDDVEGINHKEAFRIREKYSKNVGTILVGKNNAHIIAAMADPRIDYIIPFHKSSWKESLYDALGLTGYEDYTDTQNEKPVDSSRKIKNFQPSEYWDYSKSGDENAKIYLEKCKADGRIPKFPQFQNYEGYWKLLIDFKMYDNEGVGSPQTEVMPEFDMDSATEILNSYEGGHKTFPVAKDVVDDFVKKYEGNDGLQFSDKSYDYWLDKMDTISDEETLKTKSETPYLRVADSTPMILRKYGADDLPIVMRFDAMYLAQRESGVLEGHYHHLGKEVMSNLLTYLSKPDVILEMSGNDKKKLAVLVSIPIKSGEALASVEINTLKDIGNGDEKYNLVVTFFGFKENYLKNLFIKYGAVLKYKKETLSQDNPKLHKWLGTIEESVPTDSVSDSSEKSNDEIVNNDDLQYSDKDSDYIKAVDSGDMETAQRMVDEAAKKAGYTQKLYHGTNQFGFTVFDGTEGFSYDEIQFFTTDSLETANTYAGTGKVRAVSEEYELDYDIEDEYEQQARDVAFDMADYMSREVGYRGYIESDYILDAVKNGNDEKLYEIEDKWLEDIYDAGYSDEYEEFYEFQESEEGDKLSDQFHHYAGQIKKVFDALDKYETSGIYEFVAKTDNLFVLDGEGKRWNALEDSRLPERIFNGSGRDIKLKYKTREVCLWAKENGYSGVLFKNIVDSGSGENVKPANVYAFFNPREQVKSADPVTYDDNGNVIPLSERFNPEKKDIRWSDKDDSSVYDLVGENERLRKENEAIKADVERLNERLKLERQVTHGNYFNENQVGAAAGHLLNISKSDYSKKNLMTMLKELYSFIAHSEQLTWEDVYGRSYYIATELLGRTTPDVVEKDFFKDLGMSDVSEAYAEYNAEEQARWLANEVYNTYWNVSTIKTTADRYDKKIKQLNFEHRKAMSKLRDDYKARTDEKVKSAKTLEQMFYGRKLLEKDKEIAKQKLADDMFYGRIINRIKTWNQQNLDSAKNRGYERLAMYKENAERKTKIQSITGTVLDLAEKYNKNSKDKHIPEVMKDTVKELIDAIDFSSKRLLEGGEPTKTDISLAKTIGKVKDMMKDANNGSVDLVDLYGHDLDEDIKSMVESVDNIMRTVGDNEFILNKMTLADLQTLDKIVKTIRHAVNKLNKFHTVNHAKGIANLSQESMEYLDSLGEGKVYDGLRGSALKLLNWNNALPYYVFKRYGEGGLKIFEALQDGQDKLAFNAKRIIDFAEETFTESEIKEWSKEVIEFKVIKPPTEADLSNDDYVPEYQTIKMTVPQIMSLYCLNKREQAKGHLFAGGIRVADFKDSKGKIVRNTKGNIFTEKDIPMILESLTDRQKAVADKLQAFLNDECTNWGNEVSMARFGYKAFGEKNYFPIQTEKNGIEVEPKDGENNLFRILNMSFTKELTPGANNRLVVNDIFDVFAQHTTDMAKYNALALPVLDSFKWYNYTEKEEFGEGTHDEVGVKSSIENAFGKDGLNYFTTFLSDINGRQEHDRDNLSKSMLRKYKIATVGMNLRVVALQPTSYLRAGAVIDNKYLVKALAFKDKASGSAIKMAEKYCGIALWKSMGYYDTNIQKGLISQIRHDGGWKDKAVDISMKGAEAADKMTWGLLWNACDLEIRDTRTDLKVGSEEFYKAIGKRLREVIYATQVVDSTMTRSQLMRSSKLHDQILTNFASEPTLSFNMLQDAYMGLRLDSRRMGKNEAWMKNGKRMARIAVAYTLTNLVSAIIETGFDVFRDDDDDEEDILAIFIENFLSNTSITAKIPYVKEVHSLLKGYRLNRTELEWMETTYNAVNGTIKNFNGEGKPITTIKNWMKTISYIEGLPIYSLYRDTMATLDKFEIFTTEDFEEMFGDFYN